MSWVVVDNDGVPTGATCSHVAGLGEVEPSTLEGCEDCLRIGGTWVHLRECLSCGHVACCDSSPNRHATAHWNSSGDPVVKSFEPGEDWAWCYAEDLLLLPAE
jgi:ubiquitin-hydrolase Zn-finger-containing protein